MRLLLINGPNLNIIGKREINIYGKENFENYFQKLKSEFTNIELFYYHSDSEGKIIQKIHDFSSQVGGIILNAGAYSHTSVAIRDAIAAINIPVVLVHISNVYSRELFRHNNVIAPVCKGVITGFGLNSYKLGILSIIN
jgi:3-dehydroquinate dehydratase-2